jgi:hypothetical protein
MDGNGFLAGKVEKQLFSRTADIHQLLPGQVVSKVIRTGGLFCIPYFKPRELFGCQPFIYIFLEYFQIRQFRHTTPPKRLMSLYNNPSECGRQTLQTGER